MSNLVRYRTDWRCDAGSSLLVWHYGGIEYEWVGEYDAATGRASGRVEGDEANPLDHAVISIAGATVTLISDAWLEPQYGRVRNVTADQLELWFPAE